MKMSQSLHNSIIGAIAIQVLVLESGLAADSIDFDKEIAPLLAS